MKRKILAVCNGGNCRSVAVAEAFKGTYGCEALSASSYWLSRETMLMLCRWADIITPVDVREPGHLPMPDAQYWRECVMWDAEFDAKRKIINIGHDEWGNAQHDDLRKKVHRLIREAGLA